MYNFSIKGKKKKLNSSLSNQVHNSPFCLAFCEIDILGTFGTKLFLQSGSLDAFVYLDSQVMGRSKSSTKIFDFSIIELIKILTIILYLEQC